MAKSKMRKAEWLKTPRTAAVLAVLTLALGLTVGLLLAPNPVPSSWQPLPGSETLPVSVKTFTHTQDWTAKPQLTRYLDLIAPAAGVVVESRCTETKPIASGSFPIRLDQQPILALHLQLPPYRNLENGDKGKDVEALQTELRRLGHSVAKSGIFDRQTQTALTKIWKTAGVKAEPGFNLEKILWLPAEEVTPKSCPVVQGAKVAAGAVLAELGQNLKSLTLLPPGAEEAGNPPPTADRDAPARLAVLDGKTAAIQDGQVTDPTFLAAYAASPRFKAWLAKPEMALRVTTRLTQAVDTITVPPGAIYGLTGSRGCILGGNQPVPIRVLQSEFGQAVIGLESPDRGVLPQTVNLAVSQQSPPCR